MKSFLTSLIALTLAIGLTVAEDKKPDAKPLVLKGLWAKEAGDFELSFNFVKEDKLAFKIINTSTGDGTKFDADYKIKGNTISVVVEKSEKIGDFPVVPEKGTKFNFKATLEGKTLIISDYAGDNEEEAKNIVEGEYKEPKPKK